MTFQPVWNTLTLSDVLSGYEMVAGAGTSSSGDADRSSRRRTALRYLAGGARDVFWIVDTATQELVHIGAGFERIWGCGARDLRAAQEVWREAILPEDRATRDRALLPLIQGRSANYDCVYRIVRPDGEVRWIRDRGWPVVDDAGRFIEAVGVAEDVTERQAQLQRAQLLAHLTDTLRVLSDPGEVLVATSEALGRFYGVARAGFAQMLPDGQHVYVAHDWSDRLPSIEGLYDLAADSAFAAAVSAGRPVLVDDLANSPFTSVGPQSRGSDVRSAAAVPLMRDGRAAVVVFLHGDQPRIWLRDCGNLIEEVAERAWAVAERARAAQALRVSEGRYRALVLASSSIVWFADANGRLSGGQAEWADITGMPAAGLEGFGWLAAVHPDDRAALPGLWQTCLLTQMDFVVEFRVRRRDGAWRWFRSRGVPVLGADGRVTEWVGMLSDIHERREAEARAEAAAQQLVVAIDNGLILPWWVDLVAREVRWHPARNAEFGLPPELAALPLDRWLKTVHRDDVVRVRGLLQDALSERRERFDIAFRLFVPDRPVRDVICYGAITRNEKGRVVGIAGILQNRADAGRARPIADPDQSPGDGA